MDKICFPSLKYKCVLRLGQAFCILCWSWRLQRKGAGEVGESKAVMNVAKGRTKALRDYIGALNIVAWGILLLETLWLPKTGNQQQLWNLTCLMMLLKFSLSWLTADIINLQSWEKKQIKMEDIQVEKMCSDLVWNLGCPLYSSRIK